MKTNIRIACSRMQRCWFSGVVLYAAALSVACGNQSPAQEGRVDKSSTAMQVQWGDRIDETLDWNEHLIDAIFSAGTIPPPALRAAAIMNVAIARSLDLSVDVLCGQPVESAKTSRAPAPAAVPQTPFHADCQRTQTRSARPGHAGRCRHPALPGQLAQRSSRALPSSAGSES